MIFQHTKVGTAEIRGTDCDVYITKAGQFKICVATGQDEPMGKVVGSGGASFEEAQRSAAHELAKDKVKIAFEFRTSGGDLVTALGIHSGMNKVIVRRDGKAKRIDYAEFGTAAYHADTPDEVFTRLREINTEIRNLDVERRKLNDKHSFKLGLAVRAVIRRAAEAQIEKEGA